MTFGKCKDSLERVDCNIKHTAVYLDKPFVSTIQKGEPVE